MAMYVQIVFSLILERIAFGVSPSRLSVLGTCVIMASAIYVAVGFGFLFWWDDVDFFL